MRDEVFSKIPDRSLRIYAVWQPILSGDTENEVPEAARLLAGEPRASLYWDPQSEAGYRFKHLLDLPVRTPAWDAYFLYTPGIRWESPSTGASSAGGAPDPPLPVFWMHQLTFPDTAAARFADIKLDGARFREEVEKVLKAADRKRTRIEDREWRIEKSARFSILDSRSSSSWRP